MASLISVLGLRDSVVLVGGEFSRVSPAVPSPFATVVLLGGLMIPASSNSSATASTALVLLPLPLPTRRARAVPRPAGRSPLVLLLLLLVRVVALVHHSDGVDVVRRVID